MKISSTEENCRQEVSSAESEAKIIIRAKLEHLENLDLVCVSKSTEVFQELEN